MKLKKFTQKDRYGNTMSYEFEGDTKPLDPTKLAEKMMDLELGVPEMMDVPDHPGEPMGSDTVPAWLTPGEFVVNAEAMRDPQNAAMVEQINNQGREVQMMQGGSIPQYHEDGGTVRHPFVSDDLLDALAQVESGGRHRGDDGELIRSPVGAAGKYQWIPRIAEQGPGYGVKPFDWRDEDAQREASRQYLLGLQQKNPDWSKEDVLRAYNWGPGNVHRYKSGSRKDIPKEAQEYPSKILRQLSEMRGHETYFNNGGLIGATPPPLMDEEDMLLQELEAEQVGAPPPLEMPDEEANVTFGGQDISAEESVIQSDFNKQKQFDAILSAVQNGQLKPDQAREAVKGMGSNWIGKFDSQARAGGVGESEGLAGTVGELSDNLATDAREALGVEDFRQGFIDDYNYITTGEKTVPKINAPDIATVETNPELNQEANPEAAAVDQVIAETEADPQAVAESEEIDNIDNSEQAAAGEQAAGEDPEAFSRVKDAFSNAFGNLLNETGLAEAAIMYLGSRALGYSHGGSMNWAAKNYLVGQQGHIAATQKLHAEGKYTKESIEKYKQSKNAADLVAKTVGPKRTGAKPTVFYTNDGQKVNAFEYEDAQGNKFLGNQTGQQLNVNALHQNPEKVKGTDEYNKRIDRTAKVTADQLKGLQDRHGAITTDKGTVYKTDLVPASASYEVARWAVTNDVSPEDVGPLLDGAYADMRAYAQQSGKRPKSIRPFLNQMVIRNRVSNPDMFLAKGDADKDEGEPTRFIDSDKLATVNSYIASQLGTKASDARVSDVANQYYNAAIQEWTQLPDSEKNKYNGAANDNENGFYVYIAERLGIDDRLAK